MRKLSVQQKDAMDSMKRRGPMTRLDFYIVGIRMTTVRSLVRMGLVVREYGVPGQWNGAYHTSMFRVREGAEW